MRVDGTDDMRGAVAREAYTWLLDQLRQGGQARLAAVIEQEVQREATSRGERQEGGGYDALSPGERVLIALRTMRLYMVEVGLSIERGRETLKTDEFALEAHPSEWEQMSRESPYNGLWAPPRFSVEGLLDLRSEFADLEVWVMRNLMGTPDD